MNARGGWLALCVLLSACASDMTEAWEVKEPLLMGARVEVEGEPSRPRPRLGERFAIRQYLALPGPFQTPFATRYDMDAALCLGFRSAGQLGNGSTVEPAVPTPTMFGL